MVRQPDNISSHKPLIDLESLLDKLIIILHHLPILTKLLRLHTPLNRPTRLILRLRAPLLDHRLIFQDAGSGQELQRFGRAQALRLRILHSLGTQSYLASAIIIVPRW